jgi:hypothetical protein
VFPEPYNKSLIRRPVFFQCHNSNECKHSYQLPLILLILKFYLSWVRQLLKFAQKFRAPRCYFALRLMWLSIYWWTVQKSTKNLRNIYIHILEILSSEVHLFSILLPWTSSCSGITKFCPLIFFRQMRLHSLFNFQDIWRESVLLFYSTLFDISYHLSLFPGHKWY